MTEAICAGAILAIALILISRSAKNPNGLVRWSSRGAFMRELNARTAPHGFKAEVDKDGWRN
jgi:hypothetical protein